VSVVGRRLYTFPMNTLDRITVDPKVCLGQPTIRHTRLTVSTILKMFAAGRSAQDVLAAYPELEEEDLKQVMLYAAWLASDHLHVLRTA
jgi:uncharacterized protein (DUF433 family)